MEGRRTPAALAPSVEQTPSKPWLLATGLVIVVMAYYGCKLGWDVLSGEQMLSHLRVRPVSWTRNETKAITNMRSIIARQLWTCPNADSWANGGCVFEWGIRASLAEAIEPLTITQDARLLAQVCRVVRRASYGWVERRALFARLIGSLIGMGELTGLDWPLDVAVDLVRRARPAGPAQFVNLATGEARGRGFGGGHAVVDLAAGLPELAALSRVRRSVDDDFADALGRLPASVLINFSFWDTVTLQPARVVMELPEWTRSFLQSVETAHAIRPSRVLGDILAGNAAPAHTGPADASAEWVRMAWKAANASCVFNERGHALRCGW